MVSTGAKLVTGLVVAFFAGLGLIGISAKDTQFLTDNIDSVIGGAIAIISLYGFIEHHLQQAKHERETEFVDEEDPETETTTAGASLTEPATEPAQ